MTEVVESQLGNPPSEVGVTQKRELLNIQYNLALGLWHQPEIAAVVREISAAFPHGLIIDFGSGGNTIGKCAPELQSRLLGVDNDLGVIAQRVIAEIEPYPGVGRVYKEIITGRDGNSRVLCDDVRSLSKIPDNATEVVVGLNIITVLKPDDLKLMLQTILRILKPGGKALLLVNIHPEYDVIYAMARNECRQSDSIVLPVEPNLIQQNADMGFVNDHFCLIPNPGTTLEEDSFGYIELTQEAWVNFIDFCIWAAEREDFFSPSEKRLAKRLTPSRKKSPQQIFRRFMNPESRSKLYHVFFGSVIPFWLKAVQDQYSIDFLGMTRDFYTKSIAQCVSCYGASVNAVQYEAVELAETKYKRLNELHIRLLTSKGNPFIPLEIPSVDKLLEIAVRVGKDIDGVYLQNTYGTPVVYLPGGIKVISPSLSTPVASHLLNNIPVKTKTMGFVIEKP
jgi:hypothetical protein